jgi:hypothetical protein
MWKIHLLTEKLKTLLDFDVVHGFHNTINVQSPKKITMKNP